MKVLYICTGNTCRSPMAKLLAEVEADKKGIALSARSRGMAAHEGDALSMGALKVLAEEGIDGSFHRAKTVTDEDIEWADVIYAMTHTMAENLKRGWPQAADKIRPFAEIDIVDPFGGSLEIYRRAKDRIKETIEENMKGEAE
ncbi:Low molecular weight protein-tyrosine-phosphatase ywlE [Aedoeadaptatus ivorii]|uniref:Low molecular weight protein-tyrosine-phosphatase ywlE n=1 Tax=Aedoeadaptatus ivorii TaxID=54006 RepID=A0A3S4YK45_9FIRM|nr:low molecular weight protein arginine phosphatase [Peptoniphilus ivorii]MDQ0507958.1 protein-tyrosine phosphatase [Peptoniphilus ivorii]VEJ34777.1 Low molecular weight protein-tyrosine-phosphatase ywlE [Peptoniphilus ivorii]